VGRGSMCWPTREDGHGQTHRPRPDPAYPDLVHAGHRSSCSPRNAQGCTWCPGARGGDLADPSAAHAPPAQRRARRRPHRPGATLGPRRLLPVLLSEEISGRDRATCGCADAKRTSDCSPGRRSTARTQRDVAAPAAPNDPPVGRLHRHTADHSGQGGHHSPRGGEANAQHERRSCVLRPIRSI
jgi:hypothetical protein